MDLQAQTRAILPSPSHSVMLSHVGVLQAMIGSRAGCYSVTSGTDSLALAASGSATTGTSTAMECFGAPL